MDHSAFSAVRRRLVAEATSVSLLPPPTGCMGCGVVSGVGTRLVDADAPPKSTDPKLSWRPNASKPPGAAGGAASEGLSRLPELGAPKPTNPKLSWRPNASKPPGAAGGAASEGLSRLPELGAPKPTNPKLSWRPNAPNAPGAAGGAVGAAPEGLAKLAELSGAAAGVPKAVPPPPPIRTSVLSSNFLIPVCLTSSHSKVALGGGVWRTDRLVVVVVDT